MSKIYIRVYFGLQVCLANLLLRGTSGIRAASAYPALLQIGGADARSLAEIKRRRTCCTSSIYFGVATTQMLCQQMYIRVHLLAASFCYAKTSLLPRNTAIHGGSEKLFAVSLLQIGGTDTRREQKLTAGVSLIR